ncbi:MAG TPA: penicillin-binding protein 2 [Candidatus Methanoperedens sp.]|nr:penicillin-binding protein 2 [Candidatus Methanoperedens sp.]
MENSRPKTILITIYLCFVFVLIKLFYWQVIKGQELRDKAISQIYKLEKIIPQQGNILSSDSYPLSLDYSYYNLALYKPNFKKELDNIVKEISQIKPEFATENAKLIDKLRNPPQKWIEFPTQFSRDEVKSLSKIDGIDFSLKQKRYYPENELAKNIIINLERYYRRQISGQIGFTRTIVDGTGGNLLTRKNWQKREIDGLDIHTSLNRKIQFMSENTLKNGVEKYQADSASLIIINPQSGEIIAMASVDASPSAQNTKIPNIGNLFEPGSIFKPLIMATALDSKSITSDFICSKCNQPRVIGQYTINNWDNSFHPDSSLKDIIKNSDNIGMTYVMDQLGLKKFQDYFSLLKLNQKTGVELSGESISPLKTYWSDIDLATAAFGQGLAVNQLQMIQAFNTIANDGKLVKVHLNRNTPTESQDVFTLETTNLMKDVLSYAVENSPVATLKAKEMDVCAKSGTAQVAIGGKYTDSNFIGSYIGFSPCHNPKFTMIVTVNNPKLSQWGSSTAAPIWFELAQNIEPLL